MSLLLCRFLGRPARRRRLDAGLPASEKRQGTCAGFSDARHGAGGWTRGCRRPRSAKARNRGQPQRRCWIGLWGFEHGGGEVGPCLPRHEGSPLACWVRLGRGPRRFMALARCPGGSRCLANGCLRASGGVAGRRPALIGGEIAGEGCHGRHHEMSRGPSGGPRWR